MPPWLFTGLIADGNMQKLFFYEKHCNIVWL